MHCITFKTYYLVALQDTEHIYQPQHCKLEGLVALETDRTCDNSKSLQNQHIGLAPPLHFFKKHVI